MDRFLKYFGLLALIGVIVYSSSKLYQTFPTVISSVIDIVGILTIVVLAIRLIMGRNWIKKIASEFFIGNDLIKATENFLEDLPNPKKETTANLVGHLVYRFTRLGIIGLAIAVIPAWLLYQQNQLFGYQNEKVTEQTVLIRKQTDLLDSQDKRFEQQNMLIEGQNERIDTQSNLLRNQNFLVLDQNRLFGYQNALVRSQNVRIDSQITLMGVQNDRLNFQNNLIEAERRSSLIFLMSNVLDKVDDEIREQRKDLPEDSLGNTPDSIKYKLSKPLISRIVGLSRAFRPYKVLQGDTLSDQLVSPERGQLFVASMENNLDSITQNTIVRSGDFSNAIIGRVNLSSAELIGAELSSAELIGAELSSADLSSADLHSALLIRANLIGANLFNADLFDANFFEADLSSADFSSAHLSFVNLSRANLSRAKGLSFEQLVGAKSLYKVRNLSAELRQQLQIEKPCLFKDPDGPEACP